MKAGFGELQTVPPKTFVTNISGVNTFLLCNFRWWAGQVARRVPNVVEHGYLSVGKVGHAAIQDLHTLMGVWAPDAALGIAHTHAGALLDEVHRLRAIMSEKDQEDRTWFAKWLTEALPRYAQKYRRSPWEQVIHVEKPLWVLLELEDLPSRVAQQLQLAGYERLCLVGVPDAVAVIRGRTWHVQRKFFSAQTDLRSFIDMGPAQKHEVFYLQAFDFIHQLGDLEFPAGHTLFDLLRKLEPARHPSTYGPPKSCKCFHPDADQHFLSYLAAHPVNAKKDNANELFLEHRQADLQKIENYNRDQEARQHAYDTWLERAFLREECVIKKAQRERIWEQILFTCGEMALVAAGEKPALLSQGWACDAYHRSCPYKKVTAGYASIDGPQYVTRDDNYTDIPEDADGS